MTNRKFGWPGRELERRAFDAYRLRCENLGEKPVILDCYEASNTLDEQIELVDKLTGGKIPFSWDLSRTLKDEGKISALLKAWYQFIGDCVAVSTNAAIEVLAMKEVGILRQEELIGKSNPSWTYATGRNFVADQQIPRGRDGSDDGMLGIWAAESVNRYGLLFQEYFGVPAYSNETTKWGNYAGNWKNENNSWYSKYKTFAKPHTVLAIRCSTFEDGLKIMKAGGVLTIASNWGFKMQYRGDRHVYVRSGEWYHQMYFTDFEVSNAFTGFYRMNQWGELDTLAPKNGETRGGAWQTAEDVDRELRGNQQEMFGYLGLVGWESEPNWGLI